MYIYSRATREWRDTGEIQLHQGMQNKQEKLGTCIQCYKYVYFRSINEVCVFMFYAENSEDTCDLED